MNGIQNKKTAFSIISGSAITFLLIMGSVTTWLVPLPVLYNRIKLGRSNALFIPAIVIALLPTLSKIGNPELVIISGWMILGFLIGECFEARLSIEKTVIYSGGALLIAGAFALFFYSNMAQTSVFDLVFERLKGFTGVLVEAKLIPDVPDKDIVMLAWVLPGIVAAMLIFFTWINVMIATPLLRRNRLPVPDFQNLVYWKAPEKLVWVAIFGTAGMLFSDNSLTLLCMNVMCIVLMVYFLHGIAIVSFFVNKTRIPPFLRYMLYWLIFFQFPVNLIIMGLGLFDMWIDIRKRFSKTDASTEDE